MEVQSAPTMKNGSTPLNVASLHACAFAAACLVLFSLLFHSSYRVMWIWWKDEDYNFCYFVPFTVLYLLWERRDRLRSIPSVPSWSGIVPLLAGIAFYWLGELGGEFYVIYLGSWLVLMGCAWTMVGWRKLKSALFPLCFLAAMFPFPRFITNNLTLRLKLISSKLGVALLQLGGYSAYREGNIIDLGFTKLQVVDACSGLRYFFPLIMLAILLAYYFKGAWWKKLVVVCSAVPISLITNSLRIASVGILYRLIGAQAVEGVVHDFSGWLIFMFSLILLFLEMWLLKRFFPGNHPRGVGEAGAVRGDTAGLDGDFHPPREPRIIRGIPVQYLAAFALMVVTIALSGSIDFREKTALARPLVGFPLQVSGWRGSRATMEKVYLDELKFDDYAMVDYRDAQGKSVSFYTAYYGSQSKGGSIHSPASCLPGSGWVFEESGSVLVPLSGVSGSIRVNRAYIQKGPLKELIYYWFPQRGRVLTTELQMKLYTFWDAVTSRRTDGALVRILTPVYDSEKLSDAEARLQGFTREITPVLAGFIPR